MDKSILLTNDDGIFAPGLGAMRSAVADLGDVQVVAPANEQSGVSHSITYLEPLIIDDVYRDDELFGRAVGGSPADCVKAAMLELCDPVPNLVISGINCGSNAGINVLYSGTVAAAIEGAFFGVTSIAISLSTDTRPDYERTAQMAVELIRQLLNQNPPTGSLWNINFPKQHEGWPLGVKVVPMGLERYRERLEKRIDPRGRSYYWSGLHPEQSPPSQADTDVAGLADGYVTITPLNFNLTCLEQLGRLQDCAWELGHQATKTAD